MPPISDIIATEIFLARFAQEISAELRERPATVYDSTEGPLEGSVTDYDIDTGPVWGEVEGEGLEWSIAFSGTGTASVTYKTSEEERESGIPGNFDGLVEITIPASADTAEAAAEGAELSVTIESVTLKDEEPIDDSAIDESA